MSLHQPISGTAPLRREEPPGTVELEERGLLRRARPVLLFLAALAAIMVGLLFERPLTPGRIQELQSLCIYPLQLRGPTRLLLNCDSNEFMAVADDPSRLLEPGGARHSRPAFVVAAYLGSFVTAPVAALLQPLIPTDPGGAAKNVEKAKTGLQTLLPVYLSYLGINVAVLVAAFLLYLSAVQAVLDARPLPLALLTTIGFLLAGNDVVKAFVWSPHTQMLNIFLPALGCWLLARPARRSAASLSLWSLGIAVGLLAYAAFAMVVPCLVGAQMLARRRAGEPMFGASALWEAALVGVIAVAPALLWSMFVRATVGSFDLIEVSKYHELVWVWEAMARGPAELVRASTAMAWFFLRHAAEQAVPAALILLLSGWAVLSARSSALRPWLRSLAPAAAATLPVTAIALAFYTLIGWTAARLAYAAVPPLLILAAAGAARADARVPASKRQQLLAGVAVVVVGTCVWIVLKPGPLS